MKLYQYYQDYGRMGSIEGLLILTDDQVEKYRNAELWWDELLGKHSEGYYEFSDETLAIIEIPEDVVQVLYDKLGSVLSGPFDLEYFDEQIEENQEEDDWEDDEL